MRRRWGQAGITPLDVDMGNDRLGWGGGGGENAMCSRS